MKHLSSDNFDWVVEALKDNADPLDWKQGLSTLAFITTEPYGLHVKDTILIPYLKKALNHPNPQIQKIAVRFIISFRVFDLLSDIDQNIIAESFWEKYAKFFDTEAEFLLPLKTTFHKLKKERKLQKFLLQVARGDFDKDIIKEITFQLWYRDPGKIHQALDIIAFLINEMDIRREDFLPILSEFILDLDKRIYLKEQKELRKALAEKARQIMNGFVSE
ncbi:MAG: hypothetical protein CVV50_00095 [Spirochaetae bacterium HGW-Spirochaetae-6]|nr:MAG: hypothetical protein CVV50_00095 [Spirochaetae bacterium HGW-Spirochaetae-6]